MTDFTAKADEKDPAYGWVMVFAVFLLSALAFGALGSISVFLKPLSSEFGWSRGETSLGYTVISLSSALFGILWGYIADRFGTRWFGLIAAFAMSASLFALSQQQSIWQFYGLYFLFGAFGNAMVTSPLFANVGFWFTHKPGLALGITAAGGAVGQAVVPYLCALSLEANGWQTTYILSAIVYLALALPVALLIRESPGPRGGENAKRNAPAHLRAGRARSDRLDQPSDYLLLYLYGGAHRASGAVTDRCGTYLGSGFDGFNGFDVQRCVGPNPGRKIRRPYWPVTKLYAYVGWADFIGFMVSLFGQYCRNLLDCHRIWFYLLRGDVSNSGLYANDGICKLCGESDEHYFIFRLASAWVLEALWAATSLISREATTLRSSLPWRSAASISVFWRYSPYASATPRACR